MIALWLLVQLALAGEFYLEAPPVDARAEAVAIQDQAQVLGLDARVMRRYRHGSGWEFVVVVEGFDDRPGAEEAAQQLAEVSGQGIAVYRLEGSGAPRPDGGTPAPELPPEGLPEANELLQRTARSLGGAQGGQARLESAGSLRFRYERTVITASSTLTAHHDWATRGGQARVTVDVQDGSVGADSTVAGGPQGYWMATTDGARDADPLRASQVLTDLSPMARLAWPLQFAGRLDDAGPYRVARQEQVAGRACWVVVAVAPTPDQPARLWLDAVDGRPARVDFASDGGRVELNMSDWREPDTGVVVPHVVEVRRDGRLVERIDVLELTLDAELPDALFVRPGEG